MNSAAANTDATAHTTASDKTRIAGVFRSVRSRATIFVCLVAAGVAACILAIDHYRIQRVAYEKADLVLKGDMSFASAVFAREFESFALDAQMLAGTPPISGIARSLEYDGIDPVDRSTIVQLRDQLERIFVALMRHRPDYLQIRLIGWRDGGREIVRVNREADGLHHVPVADLQRKGNEPYFARARSAAVNNAVFSQISLNREHGRVTQPPTAVIRVIVPVADDAGEPFGFVVINANYETLLARALDRLNLPLDIYATDTRGNYIFRKNGQPPAPLVFSETGSNPQTQETMLIETLHSGIGLSDFAIGGRTVRAYHRQALPNANDPGAALGITLLQDRDTVLADIRAGNRISLLLSVLLVAIVTLVTYRASRSFTAPLGTIISGIRAYSETKTQQPLPTARNDELGELSRSFEFLVTRLDETERARSRTTQRLEAITENSVDGLITIDRNGTVLDYNKGCETIFGYSAEETVGQNIRMLMPPHTAEQHDGHLSGYFRGEPRGDIGTTRQVTGRDKNGKDIPIELSISEIRLSDNEVILSGLLRDVSDRVRYEAALTEREETFRRAMHEAPTGMALVRPDGSWIDFNQALCDLFGYAPDELRSLYFRDLTHPDDHGIVEPMREKLNNGSLENYRFEKRYRHKTGRTVWVYLSVSAMQHVGSAERMLICHLHDITDRKRMEEMKNEFVSVVSHELRTPLTSIRGSLGLILGTMQAELSPTLKQLVSIAHANCERLIPLINDILDLDKLAAGQMRFDIDTISVDDTLRKAIEANTAYAEKFDVSIRSPDLPDDLTISADAVRMQQVLANLLSNACKFTPEGGTVSVNAERRANAVRISVSDEGDGIPDEFAEQIFNKFSQADSSVTRSAGGTGLGLHITKQMVEQMGGRIGFDSVPRQGATFWVDLPNEPDTVLADESPAGTPPDSPTMGGFASPGTHADYNARILHVEDDHDFARILKAFIPDRYAFDNAPSLADARQALAQHTYDLIILDPALPDGNALDLLSKRGGPVPAGTPVIVLSAESLPDRIRSIVNASFVKSQISENDLKGEILSYLDHAEKRAAYA